MTSGGNFVHQHVGPRLNRSPPLASIDTPPPSSHSCHNRRCIHTNTFQHPSLESACSARTASSSSSVGPESHLHISSVACRQRERARTSLHAICRLALLDRHRTPKASSRCRGCICAFRQSYRSALRRIFGWLSFRSRKRSWCIRGAGMGVGRKVVSR